MSIELKHLRYADAAVHYGSFRKAADALGLKQSNLSRVVRTLEDRLGYQLFERSNGGVQPTPAGRDFLKGARRILNDLQTMVGTANAEARGTVGQLRIGFYTTISAGHLRNTLFDYDIGRASGREKV